MRKLMANTTQTVENTPGGSGLLDIQNCMDNYAEFAENYSRSPEGVSEFEAERCDAEGFETGIVNGQWKTNTDHPDLADGAVKDNGISISDDDWKLLMAASKLPDDGEYHSALMLHGTNNYMTTLHFLYNCASYVRSGKNNKDAIKLAAKDVNFASENAGAVAELKEKVDKMLNSSILAGVKETSNSARYYKVVGFAMHLLGDLYAHRTIVPQYTVKGTNPANRTNTMFGSSDFKKGTHTIEPDATLKEWAKNSSKHNSVICKNWKCFQRTVQLGVMEFRDIKNFAVNAQTGLYEDNKNFCSERYTDSENACNTFLQESYGKEAYDGIFIMYPVEGNVLNEFKSLSKRAKEPFYTDYDETFWSEVSTKSYV